MMNNNNIDLFEKFKQDHPELSGRLWGMDSKSQKAFEESCEPGEQFEEKEKGDLAKIISVAISLAKQFGVLPETIGKEEIDSFIKIASKALDLSFYREIRKEIEEIKQGKFERVRVISKRIVDYIACKISSIAYILVKSGTLLGKESIRAFILLKFGVDVNEALGYISSLISINVTDLLINKIEEIKELVKSQVDIIFRDRDFSRTRQKTKAYE